MDDVELITAFETNALAATEFPHERHVRVAWGLAQRYGREEGLRKLIAGIRAMASRAGRPDAYHVTMSRAWFELIAGVDDLASAPELFDKAIINRYYSPNRLAHGRDRWLTPDLHPLRLPQPAPTLSSTSTDLQLALRLIPTAVGVIATHGGGSVHATTVSSFTSVSRTPALISVCLNNGSRALDLVRQANAFALSVLASDQNDLATHFAAPDRPSGPAQFAGVAHQDGTFGPVIERAVAWLGCRLHAIHPCGDHHIVLGEVGSAHTVSDKHPLIRHGGAYNGGGRPTGAELESSSRR